MVWPFRRRDDDAKGKTPKTRPQAPRAADADERLLAEIREWLGTHAAATRVAEGAQATHLHLGLAPAGSTGPAGAVLKVKRGKLSWVDLFDPALRDTVNALVRYLDKQQKWSFNGVISTKYDEE